MRAKGSSGRGHRLRLLSIIGGSMVAALLVFGGASVAIAANTAHAQDIANARAAEQIMKHASGQPDAGVEAEITWDQTVTTQVIQQVAAEKAAALAAQEAAALAAKQAAEAQAAAAQAASTPHQFNPGPHPIPPDLIAPPPPTTCSQGMATWTDSDGVVHCPAP